MSRACIVVIGFYYEIFCRRSDIISFIYFEVILIHWTLQDRVLFHRLEHICYCVEHNEWPFPKRMSYIPMNYDSRSGTPVGSSTPKDDPDLSQSDAGDSVYDGVKVMSHLDKDFEVKMSEVGHILIMIDLWWLDLLLIFGGCTRDC